MLLNYCPLSITKPYEANVKMYFLCVVDEGLSLVPRTTINAATTASNAANSEAGGPWRCGKLRPYFHKGRVDRTGSLRCRHSQHSRYPVDDDAVLL